MRRYRKYLAVAISVQLLANLITGCAAADKAKDIGNGAVKKVGSIQESITEWYSKINLDKFKNGWNYAVKLTSSSN